MRKEVVLADHNICSKVSHLILQRQQNPKGLADHFLD